MRAPSGVQPNIFRRADAKAKGAKFGRKHALTLHQQQEARKRLAEGETQPSVARSYNVSQATICVFCIIDARCCHSRQVYEPAFSGRMRRTLKSIQRQQRCNTSAAGRL